MDLLRLVKYISKEDRYALTKKSEVLSQERGLKIHWDKLEQKDLINVEYAINICTFLEFDLEKVYNVLEFGYQMNFIIGKLN